MKKASGQTSGQTVHIPIVVMDPDADYLPPDYRPGHIMFDLKTWKEPFEAILNGTKKFEFRLNDRQFRVGDTLNLKEYDPDTNTYSERTIRVRITYMLTEGFGCPEGYCVMSINRIFSFTPGEGVTIYDDFGKQRVLGPGEWHTYFMNMFTYFEPVK